LPSGDNLLAGSNATLYDNQIALLLTKRHRTLFGDQALLDVVLDDVNE
jgi:hypothetical protein